MAAGSNFKSGHLLLPPCSFESLHHCAGVVASGSQGRQTGRVIWRSPVRSKSSLPDLRQSGQLCGVSVTPARSSTHNADPGTKAPKPASGRDIVDHGRLMRSNNEDGRIKIFSKRALDKLLFGRTSNHTFDRKSNKSNSQPLLWEKLNYVSFLFTLLKPPDP